MVIYHTRKSGSQYLRLIVGAAIGPNLGVSNMGRHGPADAYERNVAPVAKRHTQTHANHTYHGRNMLGFPSLPHATFAAPTASRLPPCAASPPAAGPTPQEQLPGHCRQYAPLYASIDRDLALYRAMGGISQVGARARRGRGAVVCCHGGQLGPRAPLRT